MATSRIPKFPAPYRHSTDADYVVLRARLTVGGVVLNRGDHLPVDSPLRKQPHRLEAMCRLRRLAPQLQPVQAVPKVVAVETPKVAVKAEAPKAAKEDFDSMTYAQLKRLCKERGIYGAGTRDELLARLRGGN